MAPHSHDENVLSSDKLEKSMSHNSPKLKGVILLSFTKWNRYGTVHCHCSRASSACTRYLAMISLWLA